MQLFKTHPAVVLQKELDEARDAQRTAKYNEVVARGRLDLARTARVELDEQIVALEKAIRLLNR